MNVLVIGRGVPNEKYPTNGVFEFDQAKALAKNGLHVTYFAIDMRTIRRKRKIGLLKGVEEGVEWYSVNIPVGPLPGRSFDAVRTYILKKLYKKVFGERNPDIIHAHFYGPAYCAAKLADEVHVPLVVTEHCSLLNKDVVDSHILTEATYAYSRASAVIAVGKSLANSIQKKTGILPIVVPNVMGDESFFQSKRKPHDDYCGFVYAGNLIERKRPLLLIDAFIKAYEKNPKIRLGIIGGGPLEADIRKKIEESGMSECIRLYGRLTRGQMAQAFCDYDCFVLPSANETFGVVYIEALAAGLPIIATACGGPEDFYSPELGLKIPVDDEDALVNAIEKMAGSAAQYDSDDLKAFVQARFSEHAVAKMLHRVYSHCISA